MNEGSKGLLRRERERRGWSRSYVAEKTESDPRTVGRWERGDKLPNSYHLQLLCELFGMLPYELGLLRDDEVDNQATSSSLPVDSHEQQIETPALSSPPEPQVTPPIPSETSGISETSDQPTEPAVHSDSAEEQAENAVPPSFETISSTHHETNIFSPEFVAGSMMHPVTVSVHAIPKGHTLLRRIIMGGMAALLVASFIFAFLSLSPRLLHGSRANQSSTAVCQGPSTMSIKSAPGNSIPTYLTGSNTGYISFVSSGQFTMNSNQGMDDEMQIVLHHVPVPAPGKSYYVWMAGDTVQSETNWYKVGTLTFANGNASLFYHGDQQHTNLLATYSHFRITEEVSYPSPLEPSFDSITWKYQADISQTLNPTSQTNYSLLAHLRHLLVTDPEIHQMGLQGGLDFWLSWNMHEIEILTRSAANDWNTKNLLAAHNQFICMLDHLDGRYAIQNDVPSGTPVLVDSSLVPVGLLYGTPHLQPPGYLTHIEIHIGGVSSASGTTSGQRKLASLLQSNMNNLSNWLSKVHLDTKHLADMSNAQLNQQEAQNQLRDMETLVQSASNDANWIYTNIQYLATLDVQAY